jgi:hypothetical protein
MRGRLGVSERLSFVGCAATCVAALSTAPAFADETWFPAADQSADLGPSKFGWREVFGGADAARDQWLVYSGMTVAPWSREIYSDGWRLRIGGGYGQFGYDRDVVNDPGCGTPPAVACSYSSKHFEVDHSYAEALVGYHLRLGELTAKAFAGASMSSEQHLKPDPMSTVDGTQYGAKVALELWLNMGDAAWTSLDGSYATARSESYARWRAGWRVEPQLSVGPELRYDKNIESSEDEWDAHAGLFARYEWIGGEVSLAGGAAGRIDNWGTKDLSPYGTLNVLFQY